MRHRYVVAYDIADPGRLRATFRTLRGYGDPIQYSVFVCDLGSSERMLMLAALDAVINHREDRVLIVDLGPTEGTAADRIVLLGRQDLPSPPKAVII
jgi:CRISPR-associated protein Cas2